MKPSRHGPPPAGPESAESGWLLAGLPQALPCMMAYWGLDMRCRYANQAYLDWFGLTAEQAIGSTAAEILGPVAEESMRAGIEAAEAARSLVVTRRTTAADGRPLVHEIHYIPDRHDGRLRGLYVLAFDTTRLKEVEQRLREADEALDRARTEGLAARQAQARLLAGMGREIRTPMQAIVDLAHQVRRDIDDALQRERLDRIEAAAHHLLRVIDDVLDLTEAETGKLELEQVEFDLEGTLAAALDRVAGAARERDLELALETSDVPARLLGDPARLGRMLATLLGDAVRSTESGSVRLRAEPVDVGARAALLRFSVTDTGIGVEPAVQARLFEPFEQRGPSTTGRGGTGLELALTRQFARLMGGEAGLESLPGGGSTVWFTARLGVPVTPPAPVPGRQPEAAEADSLPSDEKEQLLRLRHQGQRILLAEDNPVNQEVAVTLLEGTGLEVDLADHGAHALELAVPHRHDMVLMDVQMPVMDGLQATRELRRKLGAGVPIVAMTANVDDEERQACLAAGMNDHLPKPVTPDALYDMLLRWLPRRRDAASSPASGGAAATTAADWLARAERIGGLSTSEGLANAAGAAPLYQRMLRRYADIYVNGLAALRGAATPQEREAAMVACHSARGACALIGATELAARLRRHEEALGEPGREAAALSASGREIEDTLRGLAGDIGAALR